MKTMSVGLVFCVMLLVLLIVCVSFAQVPVQPASHPDWADHAVTIVSILSGLVMVLLGFVWWVIKQWKNSIDTWQEAHSSSLKALVETVGAIDRRLVRVETTCRITHGIDPREDDRGQQG